MSRVLRQTMLMSFRFAKSSSKTEIVSDACINFVSAATALSTATSFSLFASSFARFATAISAANLLFLSRTAISGLPPLP